MSGIRKNLFAVGFVLLAAAILAVTVAVLLKGAKEDRVEVTSRTILERITDRYFVVTKSVYVDQKSTITVDKGSKWSNFFWGQTVEAEGVVRVDIGVDLTVLNEADITVDKKAKLVRVSVPSADILNASQHGDIEVESDQGVLKYLLDNDPNDDHNRALEQLLADAREAVHQDEDLFVDARQDAIRLLDLIVEGTGYKLVATTAATEEI